jgi:hypothetical protein
MPKKKESQTEREARIARLQELYASGRIEEVLIPEDADVEQLIKDISSGSSEAERRLAELLKDPEEG